jgi:hypothetical protein
MASERAFSTVSVDDLACDGFECAQASFFQHHPTVATFITRFLYNRNLAESLLWSLWASSVILERAGSDQATSIPASQERVEVLHLDSGDPRSLVVCSTTPRPSACCKDGASLDCEMEQHREFSLGS